MNVKQYDQTCAMSASGSIMNIVSNDRSYAHYVVGILSFGGVCGTKDPRVYTKVSSYLDWIEETVRKT